MVKVLIEVEGIGEELSLEVMFIKIILDILSLRCLEMYIWKLLVKLL